jgi:hypothetical protein
VAIKVVVGAVVVRVAVNAAIIIVVVVAAVDDNAVCAVDSASRLR